jgi:hypothetical protein
MLSSVSEQERRFLSSFPDYRERLNLEKEGRYIRERLASTRRREHPFPFVWVEDVMTPDFYRLLEAAWPDIEVFPPDERANRRDLVPSPPGTAPRDARTSTYAEIPACMRQVWDFFILEINRRIVGPWLRQTFGTEIDERLALIEALWRERRMTTDYYEPPYIPKMNVGRLMLRGNGFRLRPHADALAYLVTALYYFPEGPDQHDLGTTLFSTDGSLPEEAIADRGKTVYFQERGIATTPAFHAPFRGNSLLAFVNSPRSAHGMQITTPGVWRRVYQSHLSIKGDSHHL